MVWAESGSLIGGSYVEYANEGDPYIIITSPTSGESVNGDVPVAMTYSDSSGTNIGVKIVSVYVDGVALTTGPGTFYEISWPSYRASNGSHQIWATATDADGNSFCSNIVTFISQNEVSQLAVTPEEATASQPVHISASLSSPVDWRVSIKDVDDNEVWYTTGNGASVSVNWPGGTQNGLYLASVTSNSAMGSDYSLPIAINPTSIPDALIVMEEYVWSDWKRAAKKAADIVKGKALTYTVLLPLEATWPRISSILGNSNCKYCYISCHGNYYTYILDEQDEWTKINVTHVLLIASHVFLYSQKLEGMPDSGQPDPAYTSANSNWTVAYATDLNRYQSPSTMKFAWLDACFTGRIGAYRRANDPYYGAYGLYSCHETNAWNDMAYALGITYEASYSRGCGYIGWYAEGWGTEEYSGGNDHAGIVAATWSTLANGYNFGFTREWIHDHHGYTMDPNPDKLVSYGRYPKPPLYMIAPFYNWRFWGNTTSPLF